MKFDFMFYKIMFKRFYGTYLESLTYDLPTESNMTSHFESYIADKLKEEGKSPELAYDIFINDMRQILNDIISHGFNYLYLGDLKDRYSDFKVFNGDYDYYRLWALENYFGLSPDYSYLILSIISPTGFTKT